MESIEKIKKVLIVIDMVNGFTKEGIMHTSYMNDLIPEIKRLIEMFMEEDSRVLFVKESHNSNSSEFKKFPVHCIEETSEAKIVEELSDYINKDNVYKKNSTSAIFAPDFMNDIKKMKNLREVILTGGCIDICVMNTAIPLVNYFDQNDMDVDVIVPLNACDTYDSPDHNREEYNDMAKKFMKQSGITLVKKYINGGN